MEEGGSTDEPPEGNPRDGLIRFDAYSLQQLRELQFSIDQRAYPKNFSNLLAALRLKEGAEPALADGNACVGRFTRRTGLLGWVQAKIMRSPVYGRGSLDIGTAEIALNGWQRTWLGVPIETQVVRRFECARNAVLDDDALQFEIERRYLPPERIRFQPELRESARQLLEKLPGVKTPGFLRRWSAISEFNQKLRAVGKRPLITPLIIALNAIVFAAMVISAKKLTFFVLPDVLNWGANFGPLTVNGQWWRLLTALFVHSSLIHLGLNMWALWNVGRLSERLYGRASLLFLYVASGLLASLTSVVWNPAVTSLGASGAIFGLFGAFLAFLGRQRSQIPASVIRRHWFSTLAFVLFNMVNGAIQPGIDNAAHVGGLLSGFVLGYILARPLELEVRKRFPLAGGLAASAFLAISVFAAIWQVKGIGSGLTISEGFFRTHNEYLVGEAQNLQLWNSLALNASSGRMSDAELGRRFEQDILPFWRTQKDELKKDSEKLKGAEKDFALLVASFADIRFQWASAIVDATENSDRSRLAQAMDLMAKTNVVQAKLDRVGIRSSMDHRPRALGANALVVKIRRMITGVHWTCVADPADSLAATDDPNDGPAVRHELGCRAQRLLMSGDYENLDALMNQSMRSVDALPDGSSRYEGVVSGLYDLLDSGTISAEIALGLTADWRRKVQNSVMAELVESMVFNAWAWSARGHGAINSVTAQNLALYNLRTEMAAAGLEEIRERAADNPLWYTLSLDVGLDQSQDRQQLRALFDQGRNKVPNYPPLYRRMMRILMPRWGGSYEEEDEFIRQVSQQPPLSDLAHYAALYSSYVRMEGDDVDVLNASHASWSEMQSGYRDLMDRYPKSDFIINSFANFACRAGDADDYNVMRAAVGTRFSSSAWTTRYSLGACDRLLAGFRDARVSGIPLRFPKATFQWLGGAKLGMTPKQLTAARGPPIRQESTHWIYNTTDPKHGGLLTVVFSRSPESSEETIQSIAYAGHAVSAPREVPFLNELSSAEIISMYGPQIAGTLTLEGPMTFKFKNGIYADTRDEKVFQYGIFVQQPSRHDESAPAGPETSLHAH